MAGHGEADAGAPAWIVLALGASQVIGYGTLYYAFSILAADIARDLNWPVEWAYGAFSAALLAGGLSAPLAGRWIDRFGAGPVMAVGSILSGMALGTCALAPGAPVFIGAFLAVQAASSLVLYDAAFAALAQVAGQGARRSITHLTLIAGFASTLFWPLTAWLQGGLDWRGIYLVYAGLNLVVCCPLHLALARAGRGRVDTAAASAVVPRPHEAGTLTEAERRPVFRLLLVAFSLGGFILGALLVHIVPLLGTMGLGASAVLVAALFGPAQVAGRFVNMLFGAGLSPVHLAVVSALLPALAVLILMLTAPWLPGAIAFALLFGLGSGLVSIVRGTLPLALFGRAGFGARLGNLAAFRLAATSIAPFAFALMLDAGGPQTALGVSVVLSLLAVAIFLRVARYGARPVPDRPSG